MSKGTVNKAIIIGRLGSKPEVRYVPSGSAVANFSVATNRSYKDKDGNWKEETDWHRVSAWTKLAEFSQNYLDKGMRVYVEGRIQYREWEDQNGVKRTSTDIVANDIQMLDSKESRSTEQEDFKEPKMPPPESMDTSSQDDEDVPF
ncbi:MAG: single-stranded DNA-binding protein [Calditrichia bacterium]